MSAKGKDFRNQAISPPKLASANTTAAQVVLARRSNEQIPLSLGKASLRIRLEAYYSLIAPETLFNRTAWLHKYDQIYEKVRAYKISWYQNISPAFAKRNLSLIRVSPYKPLLSTVVLIRESEN